MFLPTVPVACAGGETTQQLRTGNCFSVSVLLAGGGTNSVLEFVRTHVVRTYRTTLLEVRNFCLSHLALPNG